MEKDSKFRLRMSDKDGLLVSTRLSSAAVMEELTMNTHTIRIAAADNLSLSIFFFVSTRM